MGAAAKAVVKLLGGADRKRGGFLRMKRAEPAVVRARLFQGHMLSYQIDNVDPSE
jgi:hypothetical protein